MDEFTLFDTAIGSCAIVWNTGRVVGVQLPERTKAATGARVRRRFPGAHAASAPPPVGRAIADIDALLRGNGCDPIDVVVDTTSVPEFDRRVYDVTRTIPPGATLSYGDVAERLGARSLARDVGQALARNPFPLVVPCHRVLATGGRIGGFSANGGITMKLRLLAIEGALMTSAR